MNKSKKMDRPISPYNKHLRPHLLQRGKGPTIVTPSAPPVVRHQSKSESNVEVFVRVRPSSAKESALACKNVVKVIDDQTLVFDPKEPTQPFYFRGELQKRQRDINRRANRDLTFDFNRVFDEMATNEEIFKCTTKRIVHSIFEGFNCSVFAYGATGAGKTYTMLGTHENPGISYLTIVEVLNQIDNFPGWNISLGVSYVEVYNESVRDLLHPATGTLQLREESGKVSISGLVIEKIFSSDQLFELLASGNKNRSQHFTDSNAESSRSHAIFQVYVHMECGTQIKTAKLSMIDLAGSERGAATGCKGARFKEGSNINKSLLALGNCINALADGLRHVPYRDSKLTRILKDSLGGNCQTMMIANISPSSISMEDTYNTLKYASRAKSIRSKLTMNVATGNLSAGQYKVLVDQLQARIKALEQSRPANGGLPDIVPDIRTWSAKIDEVMQEKSRITLEVLHLQSHLKLTEWRLARKNDVQLHQDPSLDPEALKRVNQGICQLMKRAQSIRERLEALKEVQATHCDVASQLLEELKAQPTCFQFLEPVLRYHEAKIEIEEHKVSVEHQSKILRLQDQQEKILKSVINTTIPAFTEFYALLRAHGFLTDDLAIKYQESMKASQRFKTVTFDLLDEEEEAQLPESDRNLHLSLTPVHVKPVVTSKPAKTELNLPLRERVYNIQMNGLFPKKQTLLSKGKTLVKRELKFNDNPSTSSASGKIKRKHIATTPRDHPYSATQFRLKLNEKADKPRFRF